MITWNRKSGPIHYVSQDHNYSVQEGYRWGRFGFASMFTGCLKAAALGPIRETAEEARQDCERFESGEVDAEQLRQVLEAEKGAAGVPA